MKIIAANLKLLYQRRGLWVLYFVILISFLVSMRLSEVSRRSHWVNIFMIIFFGLIVADSQREMFGKPFVFLLPWHKERSKHIIFGIGLISGLVWAIVNKYLYYPDFPSGFLAFITIFLVGLDLYLIGVWSILRFNVPVVAIYSIILIFSMLFSFSTSIIQILLSFPLWTISGSVFVVWFSWRWINTGLLARKLCGEMLLAFVDLWDAQKAQKYRERKHYEKLSMTDTASFDILLDLVSGKTGVRPPFGPRRYISENLFLILSKLQGYRWPLYFPLFTIGAAIYFGYLSFFPMASLFLFIVPVFAAANMDLIHHRSLLVPGGRKEKFYGALALGFVITLLSTVFVALVARLTIPLSHIMPDIKYESLTITFHTIELRMLYLTLVVVPIGLLIGTIFPQRTLPLLFVTVAIGAMIMIIIFRESLASFIPVTAFGKFCFTLISWLSCAFFLRYYCRRKDLVGQGG